MNRKDTPLPTEAKRRLRSLAHSLALRFEANETLRLMEELREVVRSGATGDAIETFVQEQEGALR